MPAFRVGATAVHLLSIAVQPARAQAPPSAWAVDPANFDTACSPCQDFFRYANGGWDDRTTIPASTRSMG